MTKASRELERLVARIQQQLAPKAEVRHDVMLIGRHTKRKRQIDVLVSERVGQYDIKIVIDCKDYKTAVDVKGVEEFYGLLEDVGAQKGVLVCPKGFTSTAKIRAAGLQIELYSPVDTDIHKWTVRVTIPATCEFRNVRMSFGISCSAPLPFMLQGDFLSNQMIFDGEGKDLGLIIATATKKWNEGLFPTEVGEHQNLPIFDVPTTQMDSGYGMKIPVNLTVSTLVRRDLYFGQLPVPRISGFRDELSGLVISNAFTVGILSPEEVERDWQKIDREEDAPLKPVILLMGAVMWGDDGHTI
jgi:hypothetical protein